MANFTPQEIEEMLQEFFDVVGKRQYIGARYVPIFGRKGEASIVWDNSKPYEPLSIVLYQGNSYTSRQYVPQGIDITDTNFWANTGNYNAQIEAYRQEVARVNAIIPAYSFTENDTVKDYIDAQTNTLDTDIQNLGALLPANSFTAVDTIKDYIDAAFDVLPFEYGDFTYSSADYGKAHICYAIIPAQYKPKLILANDTIDTTEHEINAALRTKSALVINAGIFASDGTRGPTIVDSVIRKNTAYYNASNHNHVLYMTENGTLNAINSENITGDYMQQNYNPVWCVTAFTPFVTNGTPISPDSDLHPRSWIAQNSNGDYFIACGGMRTQEQPGLTLYGCYEATIQAGFTPYFAFNLDGGGSTALTVMGIRENSLVDFEHRKQANFIAFQFDALSNESTFAASHAVAERLILANEEALPIHYPRYWLDVTSDSNIRRLGFCYKDTAENPNTYTVDGLVKMNHEQNTLYLGVRNTAGTALIDAFAINGNTQQLSFYNDPVSICTANNRILAWGDYNEDTEYATLINSSDNKFNFCKYVAVFEQSSKQFYVDFYKYNFGHGTTFAKGTGQTVAPDGESHFITLTFDTTNNTVKYVDDTTGTHIARLKTIVMSNAY